MEWYARRLRRECRSICPGTIPTGMIWDGEAKQRERTYQAALTYYREHGDLKVPANYVDANGLHLGWWVRGVRRAYQRGTLDKEQIQRLEGIGMV